MSTLPKGFFDSLTPAKPVRMKNFRYRKFLLCYNDSRSVNRNKRKRKTCQTNDVQSLSHSKWNYKYNMVFAPEYRRQAICGKLKAEIGKIPRKLCEQKGIEILEAEVCSDHLHMLVSIPPNLAVSRFVGYLKGKISLMIFDRFADLKYKYGNRHFLYRGYYVGTVGRHRKVIEEYIRNQLQEDIANDQISMKEFYDPFTGEKYFNGLELSSQVQHRTIKDFRR